MIPTKKLELLVDEFIEQDIRFYVESKERDAEQLEFIEGE